MALPQHRDRAGKDRGSRENSRDSPSRVGAGGAGEQRPARTHKPLCAARHKEQILQELPPQKTGLSTPATKIQVTLPTFPSRCSFPLQPRFELSRQKTAPALGRAFPPLDDPAVQSFSLMDIYSPREQQSHVPTLFHHQIYIQISVSTLSDPRAASFHPCEHSSSHSSSPTRSSTLRAADLPDFSLPEGLSGSGSSLRHSQPGLGML